MKCRKLSFTVRGYTFSFTLNGKRLLFGFAIWKGEGDRKPDP